MTILLVLPDSNNSISNRRRLWRPRHSLGKQMTPATNLMSTAQAMARTPLPPNSQKKGLLLGCKRAPFEVQKDSF